MHMVGHFVSQEIKNNAAQIWNLVDEHHILHTVVLVCTSDTYSLKKLGFRRTDSSVKQLYLPNNTPTLQLVNASVINCLRQSQYSHCFSFLLSMLLSCYACLQVFYCACGSWHFGFYTNKWNLFNSTLTTTLGFHYVLLSSSWLVAVMTAESSAVESLLSSPQKNHH